MKSHLGNFAWPALPSPRGALLQALLFQFERTQWWAAERLVERQLRQLALLLRHAYGTVPYYHRRFDATGYRPGGTLTLDDWGALPLLARHDLQQAGADIFSNAVPRQYGGVGETRTSGSTGEPVTVRFTEVDRLMWQALTLRDHLWHGRDFAGKLASIRVTPPGIGAPPDGTQQSGWGPPADEIYATGPSAILSLAADVPVQVQWLQAQEPDYLLTYPTNLAALCSHFQARGEHLRRLRSVRTVGETVTPTLRAACEDALGVSLIDTYSSQEFGYIALQCPVGGQYHVMAESVLVEILDAHGRPCGPGETGRLVVTSLHNVATPLIRYELRDHAEAGVPCPCGRGLPTIARILGRSRNMLTLPSGERRWPLVGFAQYREVAPVRQYQFIQHTLEEIEARFVVERVLTAAEETRLRRVIHDALGHPFRLRFVYFPGELPRAPNGKFEEFVSRIVD
ncbi:MAG: phenylacetate--CoA ligase family protein [Burkholderiales bacterium]|nr:phenylacetate--CoA ligase family protein [Burkholderiales bacterium]